MKFYFLIQIISNSVLLGIILVTQFITYPSFLSVSKQKFYHFHNKYVNRISFIVIPFMILELFSLCYISYILNDFLLIKSLIILLSIWLSTFIIMVPLHNKLSSKYEKELVIKLINYNWLRTLMWSIKLIFILYIYYEKI